MEISNKTLAMFLVAAVTISLFGTVISLNKMNALSHSKATTGHATAVNATAQLEITTTTSIIFRVDAINFGTGSVNASGTQQNCTLITNVTKSVDCVDFTHVNLPFVLENDGNTNASVQLVSNATAQQFIGGTGVQGGPQFMYNVSNNESSSCVTPGPSAWTNVNTTAPGTQICDVLDAVDTSDTLNIHIKINIPYTTPQGTKTAVLTATATGI